LISSNARFVTVALLMAVTGLFLHARAHSDFARPSTSLKSFPIELQNWTGEDIPIPDEILKSLGPGEFLQRMYKDRTISESYVNLYLAYLPNRPALFRHLPQDCLEGSGWSALQSTEARLLFAGGTPFSANRYVIAKGSERQIVLFWYSIHGRRVASEDWMHFYLILDKLSLDRSDNALIRMNTELRPGETPEQAEKRLLAFAGLVDPLLNNYIPR